MKNVFPTISTLLAIAVFVFLNWATSQDEPVVLLLADVSIYQDSLIILDNQDDLDVNDALLELSFNTNNTTTVYSIMEYHLPSFSKDTIPMDEFKLSSNPAVSYPNTTPPNFFYLNFYLDSNNTDVSFYKEF